MRRFDVPEIYVTTISNGNWPVVEKNGEYFHAETGEKLIVEDFNSFIIRNYMSYRDSVLKTWSGITGKEALSNAVLGLCGESGEVADLVKKHVFHGHDLDKEKMIREIGDCLYYAEVLMHELNVTRQEVEEKNIEKLAKRYPLGFSSEASKNRKD